MSCGYPTGAGSQAGSSRVVQSGVLRVCQGRGDMVEEPPGSVLVSMPHTPTLCSLVLQKALKPLRKKQGLLQHLPRLGPWGISRKLSMTRGHTPHSPPIPVFLPFPITPMSFSVETTNSSDIFQPLWRCQYSPGKSLHIIDGAQTLMSNPCVCPCTQQLLCFTPAFLHLYPPFTSSLAFPSSQSGFSHSFSQLLYGPPPLAHFSSSLSSHLFSFFSYNPVHLDNFHLDCLT